MSTIIHVYTITVCSDLALLDITGELDSIEEIRQKEVHAEEVCWHILSTYIHVYVHVYTNHRWS